MTENWDKQVCQEKNQRCTYSKPHGKHMLSVNQDALGLVSRQRKKPSSLEQKGNQYLTYNSSQLFAHKSVLYKRFYELDFISCSIF